MSDSNSPTRRNVLRGSAALAGVAALPDLAAARPGRARQDDELQIALIGCGGRGTGAASQALSTQGKVRLVAMADAFSDRLENSLNGLQKGHGERVDVPADRRFVGFDAYKKAMEHADVVLLATPPGFRPMHFEHAVSLGKHVFMEKPVATDAPGVRQVLRAAEKAKTQDLKVGVGLQRHHENKYLQTIARIWDGAIGDVVTFRCYWNSGGVWTRPRREGMTEMEYQMRNWYYFNWLCGDHITEQHIHNIDVCNWVKGGFPVRAQGVGGRQVRTGKEHGEIFDHHMVEFEYDDGTRMISECRHIRDCWNSVSEHAHGTRGYANISQGSIKTADGEQWRWDRSQGNDPYQTEHDDLFAAIRAGTPYNEAEYGAKSTMTSILGRMATYSGKSIGWNEALESERSLLPERLAWDALPKVLPDKDGYYPVPMPGTTQVL